MEDGEHTHYTLPKNVGQFRNALIVIQRKVKLCLMYCSGAVPDDLTNALY